jgi:membrane protein implicated in regulation of membrane protease activity
METGMVVFLSVLGGCTLFFLISLLSGGDHGDDHGELDAGHDFDAGHDMDMGHDVDVGHDFDAGHDVGGDADVGVETGDVAHGVSPEIDHRRKPGKLSLRSLLLFGVGFGAGGAIAATLGIHVVFSSIIGALCGIIFAGLGWHVFNFVYVEGPSNITTLNSLVGKTAKVTIRIPGGKEIGEVRIEDASGGEIYLPAMNLEGSELQIGEEVTIHQIEGRTVIVWENPNL